MNRSVNSNIPFHSDEAYESENAYPTVFLLIDEIFRSVEYNIGEDYLEESLSKTAKTIMTILSKKDGITQLEISRMSHLKAPTISLTLQKLENLGYIIKKSDRYDLRSIRVYLTAKGMEYNKLYLMKVLREEEKCLAGITENDRKKLIMLLRRVIHNLSEENKK